MSEKLWFKRKRYGWGWYPITWQGWGITLLYVILIMVLEINFINSVQQEPNTYDIVRFILVAIILTGVLISICYKKGEKPRWSWGD